MCVRERRERERGGGGERGGKKKEYYGGWVNWFGYMGTQKLRFC